MAQVPAGNNEAAPEPPRYEAVKVYKNGSWEAPLVEPNDWTSRIADILLSENLVVLAGLGTSLCLNTAESTVAPTMSNLWEGVGALKGFDTVIASVGHDPDNADVEELLSRCQLYLGLNDDDAVRGFVAGAEQLIYDKCFFPDETVELTIHEMFLRKVARRSIRQPRMRLFTTNYDLCFERAAARTGFITIDGFSHSSPQQFDGSYFSYDFVKRELEGNVPDFIPNVFQLLKLHGSTDWIRDESSGRILRGAEGGKAMIFPRYGKFESSYQQPYFEMMSRLQASLRQPNSGLLVVGYGCKDKHINEPLLSALRSNVGLKVALVDPVLETNGENQVHSFLKHLIDEGDARVSLVSAKFQDFTRHIPDLVSLTEQEVHFGRTRR